MPLSNRTASPIDIARLSLVNAEFGTLEAEAAQEGKRLIYEAQQRVASGVASAFTDTDVILATMVAPMQWGKTGVMAALAKLMVNHPTKSIAPQSVFVITGMSDNDWRDQTRARFPNSWKGNILHRNELAAKIEGLAALTDALFIIDECHFGAQAEGLVDKFFTGIGLKSIDAFKDRNVRIFQTSATPDNVLLEAHQWNQEGEPEYHQLVVPDYPDTYMSLDRIDREGRLLQASTLYDGGDDELESTIAGFPSPKWHIVRLPSGRSSKPKQEVIMKVLGDLCRKNDWAQPVNHFGATRMDDDLLATPPEKHTIIYIKGLLRAAKTLNDANIGVVYEPFGESKSDSSEAQGLAGRLCGHGKQSGPGAPILFCNTESIHNYIDLMGNAFNYSLGDLTFKSATIRKRDGEGPIVKPSFCNPELIDGIELEDEDAILRGKKRNTPQAHLSPVFTDVAEAREWSRINALGGIRQRRPNVAGYHESPIQKDGETVYLVCDRDELDVRGVGLSKQSPKRLLAYYEDKGNINSVRFVLLYRKYD